MKKLMVAFLVVMSLSATSMARYWVWSLYMHGAGVEVQEGKGKIIDNGETTPVDKYVKSWGSVRGYMLYDEDTGYTAFIRFDKDFEDGWDLNTDAEIDPELWNEESDYFFYNYGRLTGDESAGSWSGRGRVVWYVYTGWLSDLDLELWATVQGHFSETEKWDESSDVWRYSDYAFGAGEGYQEAGVDGYTVFINRATLRYHTSLSRAMSDAYQEVIDAEGSEIDAVQAAADVLNDFINGKAHTDSADVTLPNNT